MLRHENCSGRLGTEQFDAIITDVPYVVSDNPDGESEIGGFEDRRAVQRDMGEWDKEFHAMQFVEASIASLPSGGWLVSFAGDEMFMQLQEWMRFLPGIKYKGAVSWHKTNPMTHIRQTGFVSSMEFVVFGIKGDKPSAWNWLGQNEMHNFLEGPICSGRERLYWHLLEGEVFPCVNTATCHLCRVRGQDDRRRHPTQKPLWVWEWLYARITEPGMKVYDPYAGTGSSGVAARKYGLDWSGSEIEEEYAKVGQMWLEGKWFPRSDEQTSMLEVV